MNSFSDFDDFMVGAWMNDGLLTYTAKVVRKVAGSVKKSGLILAVATSVASATPTIALAKTSVASIHSGVVSELASNESYLRVAELSNELRQQLAVLHTIEDITIDPELLELASQAVSAKAATVGNINDWAADLVSGIKAKA